MRHLSIKATRDKIFAENTLSLMNKTIEVSDCHKYQELSWFTSMTPIA